MKNIKYVQQQKLKNLNANNILSNNNYIKYFIFF